jgi:exonuclease III
MIGCFWNPRGFGKSGRAQCIADVLSTHKIDFVGFQETKKESISNSFLKSISGNVDFLWHYLPAKGTAGGILVGFKAALFEVLSYTLFDYCVATVVKNISDGFIWQLIVVYGSAYAEYKLDFLAELHLVMEQCVFPSLVGGDFNLVLSEAEKSSGNINHQLTFLFNDWMNKWALLDLPISNRSFTWSNNQENLILATLDHMFASTDWDSHYPLSLVRAIPKSGSDHTPLLIEFGIKNPPIEKLFRFEKWWLSEPEFVPFVIKVWTAPVPSNLSTAIDIWQFKVRRLRKSLRGWNSNVEAALKKKEKRSFIRV